LAYQLQDSIPGEDWQVDFIHILCLTPPSVQLRDANLLSSLPLIYRRPALSVVIFGSYFLPTPYHPLPF
jgi:hypothetical protein